MVLRGNEEYVFGKLSSLFCLRSHANKQMSSLWEYFMFTEQNILLDKDESIICAEKTYVQEEKLFDCVIAQCIEVSDLADVINSFDKGIKPGKQLIIIIHNIQNIKIEDIFNKIPIKKYRLYNPFYSDVHFDDNTEDIIAICLTKKVSFWDKPDLICKFNLSLDEQGCYNRHLILPKEHFLNPLYPDLIQKIFFPKELQNKKLTVTDICKSYNCSLEDAVSLWDDLYMMGALIKGGNCYYV